MCRWLAKDQATRLMLFVGLLFAVSVRNLFSFFLFIHRKAFIILRTVYACATVETWNTSRSRTGTTMNEAHYGNNDHVGGRRAGGGGAARGGGGGGRGGGGGAAEM